MGCGSSHVEEQVHTVPSIDGADSSVTMASIEKGGMQKLMQRKAAMEKLHPASDYRVSGRDSELVIRSDFQVSGLPFKLAECTNSTILILGATEQVTVDRCENCTILVAACRTSLFLRSCRNCSVFFCGQQLRTRAIFDCDLFLCTSSRPILEGSRRVRVACWAAALPRALLPGPPSAGAATEEQDADDTTLDQDHAQQLARAIRGAGKGTSSGTHPPVPQRSHPALLQSAGLHPFNNRWSEVHDFSELGAPHAGAKGHGRSLGWEDASPGRGKWHWRVMEAEDARGRCLQVQAGGSQALPVGGTEEGGGGEKAGSGGMGVSGKLKGGTKGMADPGRNQGRGQGQEKKGGFYEALRRKREQKAREQEGTKSTHGSGASRGAEEPQPGDGATGGAIGNAIDGATGSDASAGETARAGTAAVAGAGGRPPAVPRDLAVLWGWGGAVLWGWGSVTSEKLIGDGQDEDAGDGLGAGAGAGARADVCAGACAGACASGNAGVGAGASAVAGLHAGICAGACAGACASGNAGAGAGAGGTARAGQGALGSGAHADTARTGISSGDLPAVPYTLPSPAGSSSAASRESHRLLALLGPGPPLQQSSTGVGEASGGQAWAAERIAQEICNRVGAGCRLVYDQDGEGDAGVDGDGDVTDGSGTGNASRDRPICRLGRTRALPLSASQWGTLREAAGQQNAGAMERLHGMVDGQENAGAMERLHGMVDRPCTVIGVELVLAASGEGESTVTSGDVSLWEAIIQASLGDARVLSRLRWLGALGSVAEEDGDDEASSIEAAVGFVVDGTQATERIAGLWFRSWDPEGQQGKGAMGAQ